MGIVIVEDVIVSKQDSDSDVGEAGISKNTCACEGMINHVA
jgi:hypothetical protein